MPAEPPKPEPAPGWYDDPDTPGGKRYWDGSNWTDQRRAPERHDEPPRPEPARPEPARPEPASPAPPTGWYDDPAAPGGKRYWDGSKWTDERRAPESKGSLRRWYSSLSRGVQWIVAVVVGAGAVAGAIGAILALLPGPGPPLRASLSQVTVGTPYTLDQWASRAATPTASASGGVATSRLAANIMVQGGDETTSAGGATGPQGGPGIQPTPITEQDRQKLKGGLQQALMDPAVAGTNVGSLCATDVANPSCGLRSTATYLLKAHSPATVDSVERHFLTLFPSMRTSAGQPVGVPVDVNFDLTGLSGHTANISWTLYRANGLASVPEPWVKGESVLTVSGDEAHESRKFWVPIPLSPGPYYVEIDVFDEDGNRLDYARGKPDFGSGGTGVPQLGEIPFSSLTTASGATLYAPAWTQAVDEPDLTALVNPERDSTVQAQRAPEEQLKGVAEHARQERKDEGAADVKLTTAGPGTYLLRYTHDEKPTNPNLPALGEAYVYSYLFNDAGFSWRVRAAVKTTKPDGKKLASEIAMEMARTFVPPS
jgi:hypothetical protein